MDTTPPQGPADPASECRVYTRPSSMRILLAENSLFNQRLAAALLEQLGHDVVAASDGPSAVAQFQASRFDVVLIDWQLAGPDGRSAAAAMRSRAQLSGRHIPIIALVPDPLSSNPQRLPAEVDGCLVRPMRLDQLRDALAAYASRAAGHQSLPESPVAKEVDWNEALDCLQGRRGLLVELVEIFLAEHAQLLTDIDRSIEDGDAKNLRIRAHGLKGCLRYFGQNGAATIAAQMEELARVSDVSGAAQLRAGLDEAVQVLLPQLRCFAADSRESA